MATITTTSISYEEIFSDFLGFVTDYNIAELSQVEAYELMIEYLHKVVSQPYVQRLFNFYQFEDEILQFNYTLKEPEDEKKDYNFVRSVLSKGMVCEWLRPQVRSKLNTAQFFGGKEQKFFSQSNHLSELRGLLQDTELEMRKLIRDRGYILNSYLGGSND